MPIAIRCHPCAPVAATEIEQWLEREVMRVREEVGGGTVRLLRLTQELPTGQQAVGWLIEVDADSDVLESERLAEILSDMRLLGLQPTVLELAHAPA